MPTPEEFAERVERAVYYHETYGWSISRSAQEAGVSRQRVTNAIKRGNYTFSRGDTVQMLTYTKEYGMCFVDLDDTNAHLNGMYMNYVRWGVYKNAPEGGIVERDFFETEKLRTFNQRLREEENIRNQQFHAKAVYKVKKGRGDSWVIDSEPIDSDVNLTWELFSGTIAKYEAQRVGSNLSPYARR
jgi:hypothetical protein